MATLAQRLSEAEAAYHALMTGRAVVAITDQSGEQITYTRANATSLKNYIRDLKTEIAGTRPSGPIRPVFL